MENALSLIHELPSTLEQVDMFVTKVKAEALSGEYNLLEVLKQLRMAQKALELLNSDMDIERAAQKEHDKYGQKSVDLTGAIITLKEVGTKYEYEASGDPEWKRYKDAEADNALYRKQREKFLQTLEKPLTVINEETGEPVTINPVPKKSTTKLCVTLK